VKPVLKYLIATCGEANPSFEFVDHYGAPLRTGFKRGFQAGIFGSRWLQKGSRLKEPVKKSSGNGLQGFGLRRILTRLFVPEPVAWRQFVHTLSRRMAKSQVKAQAHGSWRIGSRMR